MARGTVIQVIGAHMTALRQLNGDRLEYARLMLPHHVKDNILYTVNDRKLYGFEADDQTLYPVELILGDKIRTDDAWLNELFKPINKLFGTASEQAQLVKEDDFLEEELQKLIKKGKRKKAKKFIKKHRDALGETVYFRYKNNVIKDME